MGHYTQFKCWIKLQHNTPEHIIAFLDKFINNHNIGLPEGTVMYHSKDIKPPEDIDHEFFKCERWETLLTSVYAKPSKIHKVGRTWIIDMHAELKNYDSEIQKFVDWITPYIKGRKKKIYIGWSKGERAEDQQRHYWKENP